MSRTRFDNALIVVPEDMNFCPSEELSKAALEVFIRLFPGAEEYQAETFEQIHFFTPEMFASSVVCPVCGIYTKRDELSEGVGRKWFNDIEVQCFDQSVENKMTVLPACGHSVPVIGLAFDFPAGYAKYSLTARYCYWEEEWEPDGTPPPAMTDEMLAIGNALGVSVKLIYKCFSLLPSDRRLIERLMSEYDAEKLKAALELDDLEAGHFEDHSIHPWFTIDNAGRLLAAYRDTRHQLVKQRILDLFAKANFLNDEILDIVTKSLDWDSDLLTSILYLIYETPSSQSAASFQHLIPQIKLLHCHPENEVRWRCAMALKRLPLDYEKDIEVIRTLMLDDHYSTRREAVDAFSKVLGQRILCAEDIGILKKLIEIDGTNAAAYSANQLLTWRSGYK